MIDDSIFNNKKFVFHTLGCKLNFAETSYIGKQLSEAGFVRAGTGENADVCIVNTCTVTDTADHKCRQAINRLHRQHPAALMIVVGCYAQLKPNEIAAMEGVDLVLGTNEKFDILQHIVQHSEKEKTEIHTTKINSINRFSPSCSRDYRTRYFLKIQDGCDYYCTYCTIPFARGKSRSGTISETLAEAKRAVASGAKEIVLTGVNIGDFGKRNGETFLELLRQLNDTEDNIRFRISSIEPNLLTDEIIEFVATSKKFMPHFHIPLQSGSNDVLLLMKRKYKRELFEHKILKIKELMPDAFIGADVIVGVRGETAEFFEDSYSFINSLDVSQLHVFTYSEREGTKMLDIQDVVPIKERKRRSDMLHLLSEKKTLAFYEKMFGKTLPVLWESKRAGDAMFGFTNNYVRVERPFCKTLVNTVQNVKITGWNEEKTAVTGEVVQKAHG
ncbi:MAG: tRNA (N(6)-L-threonylcarbamoyladenosine(37)-C(2))-methylthiotransferase MtaB, partial [Paludibacter sp.]|nr:tRNA (N(6)-L-threonylcarbamoyladenosine(37)-C(2))-methylthiotransferase MtaB [Paludibacter sp.]